MIDRHVQVVIADVNVDAARDAASDLGRLRMPQQ
ncbi:hypothetical protein W823_09215 [Williamsia sp. D3]|nr:hypothetical protein W823_09215 [Williamsia sp. D3]